mgnify:CR=1 FL=1
MLINLKIIGSGIINIYGEPFYGTSITNSLTVKNNYVLQNFYQTFSNCNINAISTLTISGNINFVPSFNIPNLTTISLSEGIVSFGGFANCSNIINLHIPDSITSIPDNAFYNCTSLKNISGCNNVTSIGNNAFNNTAITTYVVPNNVATIGENAFQNCYNLIDVIS